MTAPTGQACAPARPQVRVLALIDHLVAGGAELLLSRFAMGAPAAGIQLSVACLTELDGNPFAVPLRAAGVEPVTLSAPERLGPGAFLAVRRHLARLRPDILHTHLGSSDVLGCVAARSLRIPAVSTIHTPLLDEGRRERLHNGLIAAARRFGAARVIAVSEHTRREYLAQGWDSPERVITIHNGHDVASAPGQGAAVRRELGLGADDLVVGMVSALRVVKGHAVAIEAIARLRDRFPQLRLLIAGQGAEREEIERRSRPLGDAVVIAGLRGDVMRVLDSLDVCLQPSYADPFPGTVIEAMAASVPVVATAVGGIPEQVLDGETGILVAPPPTPDGLVAGLDALLSNAPLRRRLGEASRRRYEDNFTGRPWIASTRALYDVVLAEAAARRGSR